MSSMPPPPNEEFRAPRTPSGVSPGESDGKWALIFGIVGILFGPLSLLALYFAFRGRRAVEAAGTEAGKMLRVGRIVAWVAVALFAASIAVGIISAATR